MRSTKADSYRSSPRWAAGAHGETYNINADLVQAPWQARSSREADPAHGQAGILDKDKNLISSLNKKKVEDLVHKGTSAAGCFPRPGPASTPLRQAAPRSISSTAGSPTPCCSKFHEGRHRTEITL